jgi:hypothetical protein
MCMLGIMNAILYTMYPLVLMLLRKENANQSNRRLENILNFRFPVPVNYYNNNYVIFYIMESCIVMFLLYMHIVSEVFFVSLCFVMIAQYEMIKRAYENFNGELICENNNGKSIEITIFFIFQ